MLEKRITATCQQMLEANPMVTNALFVQFHLFSKAFATCKMKRNRGKRSAVYEKGQKMI